MKKLFDELKTLTQKLTPDNANDFTPDFLIKIAGQIEDVINEMHKSLQSSSAAEEIFTGFEIKDKKDPRTICSEVKGVLNKIRSLLQEKTSAVLGLIDSVTGEVDKVAGIDSGEDDMETGAIDDQIAKAS